MKTKIFFVSIILLALSSFVAVQSNDKQKHATVNSLDGVDIYFDCKPDLEYEVLGEIEQFWWTHWTDCREKMVKKAKENYSKADGIIILFLSTKKAAKAEVIHYKKQ